MGLARRYQPAISGLVFALALVCSACGSSSSANTSSANGKITAVGAENEYSDVISQIGGQYVSASAVMSDPNTDPHTFESSPKIAKLVSSAQLVVQNGLGYDDFMTTILNASPDTNRKTINVQQLLNLPDSTPNPHLWYNPTTMPTVAQTIASDLSTIDPAHASYYQSNLTQFNQSLGTWNSAISNLKNTYPGAAVATTEPVADYMLDGAGINNMTPFSFQASVMNGNDPSPQDEALQKSLFTDHKIKAFVYNQQVTDTLTDSYLTLAHQNNIPVVGVYETMPTPGYNYQSWMTAEVQALTNAIANGTSASKL
jgi:zinc/manganese transport system substrate-binding protein